MLELLKSFCSKDKLRPQMMRPYRLGEWVCASDGHVGVMTTRHIPDLPDDGPNLPGVFPKEECAVPIDINALRTFLDSIPMIDETEDEETECDRCDGKGEVECDECGQDRDCPDCDGTGLAKTKTKPTGKKIPNGEAIVELWGVSFFQRILRRLIEAADALGCSTAIRTSTPSPMGAMAFTLADAKVLLMPCRNDPDRDSYKETHVFTPKEPTP